MDDILSDTDTMRIVLAGFAMNGILSASHGDTLPPVEFVSNTAIQYADHLIKSLSPKVKKQTPK